MLNMVNRKVYYANTTLQVMSCSVCDLMICVRRQKPTLGSAMSCGRKFSASVVNAAIVNRNSKGLYTCKHTRKFTVQTDCKDHCCGTHLVLCQPADATTASVLFITAM